MHVGVAGSREVDGRWRSEGPPASIRRSLLVLQETGRRRSDGPRACIRRSVHAIRITHETRERREVGQQTVEDTREEQQKTMRR
jgi:hypothetical protein